MGVNLGTGEDMTAENIADKWDEISDMKDARPCYQGGEQSQKIFELIIKTYELIVRNNKLSSAHINFTTDNFNKRLENDNWIRRTGLQFHWHNNNYETFDDFLNQDKDKIKQHNGNSLQNKNNTT